MIDFVFVTPPRVIVGRGAALDGRLTQELAALGSRPLIVCGQSLDRSGTLSKLQESLAAHGLNPTVHLGVPPEPTLDDCRAAIRAAAGCDSVLAIGGGSVLDVAKAAALAPLGVEIGAYFSGEAAIPSQGGLPILAAPTTAGTGSEATWVGVYTDSSAVKKASIRGEAMLPRVVILDGALTDSCPPQVTADSGMDAFVQAVEAYVSKGANRFTDALALEAVILTGENLRAAVRGDRAARDAMLLGSYMAGMALNTARLGLVHGLAHPIGALTGAAHGRICALLLPPVIRFNRGSELEKYSDLAVALSAENQDLARFAEKMLDDLGVPRQLSALGVTEAMFDKIAEESLVSGSTKANPRPVSKEDVLALLQASF